MPPDRTQLQQQNPSRQAGPNLQISSQSHLPQKIQQPPPLNQQQHIEPTIQQQFFPEPVSPANSSSQHPPQPIHQIPLHRLHEQLQQQKRSEQKTFPPPNSNGANLPPHQLQQPNNPEPLPVLIQRPDSRIQHDQHRNSQPAQQQQQQQQQPIPQLPPIISHESQQQHEPEPIATESREEGRPSVQFMGFLNKHTLAQKASEQPALSTPTIAANSNNSNSGSSNNNGIPQITNNDERSVPFFDVENSVETKW
jgi:hypothetical protein